ncbi:hypothetical protein C8F01DRAFT_1265482 [Mycena amicta]|nr:hypothetical protein C8F01DRAFT_1265482 [Mycena amicta]
MPYPVARSQSSSLAVSSSDVWESTFEFCTSPTTTVSGPQKSSHFFPESPTDISPPLSPVEYPAPIESLSSPSTGTRRMFPNAPHSIVLGTSRASSIRAALKPRVRAQTVDVTPLRAVRFTSNSSRVEQVDVCVATPGISNTWRRRNYLPRRNATMPLPSLSNIKEVDEGQTQDIHVPPPHAAVPPRHNASNTSHPPVAAQNLTCSLRRACSSSSWGDVRVGASDFADATGAEELEELDDEVREAMYVNASLRACGFAYEPAASPETNTKMAKRAQTLPVTSSTPCQWQSDHILAIQSEVDEMLRETQKIKSSPSFQRTAPVRSSPLAKMPPLNISDVPSSAAATERKLEPLRQTYSEWEAPRKSVPSGAGNECQEEWMRTFWVSKAASSSSNQLLESNSISSENPLPPFDARIFKEVALRVSSAKKLFSSAKRLPLAGSSGVGALYDSGRLDSPGVAVHPAFLKAWILLGSHLDAFQNTVLLAPHALHPINTALSLFHRSSAQDDRRSKCLALNTLRLENTTILQVDYISVPGNVSTPGSCGSIAAVDSAPLCRVQFGINTTATSAVHAEAWLPDTWYGRFLALGNGGNGGCPSVISSPYRHKHQPEILFQASTTSDSDTALPCTSPPSRVTTATTGRRGLPFLNHPEVINDFAFRAIHVEAVIGKQLVAAYYDALVSKSYYLGRTRHGLESPSRAGPGCSRISSARPILWGTQNSCSQLDWAVVSAAILRACDALDGLVDGLITEPDDCQFDVDGLECRANQTSGCLTATQVDTVKNVFSPLLGRNGELLYPRYSPGAEADPAHTALLGGPFFSIAQDWETFAVLNVTRHDFTNFINAGGISTFNGDLSAYRKRGGKFITYHGRRDPASPPHILFLPSRNQIQADAFFLPGSSSRPPTPNACTTSSKNTLKLATLDDFYRLFLIPGMGHCSGGLGAAAFGQGTTANSTLVNTSSHSGGLG